MTRRLVAALAALFLLCVLAPPAGARGEEPSAAGGHASSAMHLSPAQQRFIAARPVAVVGYVGNWPPFEMVEDGQPAGLSPALLADLAKRLGLTLRFERFSGFQELLAAACSGRVDVLMNVSLSAGRTRCLVYTDPYAEAPVGLIAYPHDPQLRADPALVGVRLVTTAGAATEEYARKRFPQAVHIGVSAPLEAMELVAEGSADVFLGDAQVATRLLQNPRFQALALIRPSGLPNDLLHFAVPNAKQPLVEALNEALGSLSAAERQAYRDRWLAPLAWNERGEFALSAEEEQAMRHTLRVGWPSDFAPIAFADRSGRPSGLASEYLRKLRVIGAQFSPVQAAPWKSIREAIREEAVDVVVAVPRDGTWLGEDWIYSQPFATVANVVVAARDGVDIRSLGDLNGLRVASSDPDRLAGYVQSVAPRARVVPVPSTERGLQDVVAGNADAYVGNLAAIDAVIRARHSGQLEVVATTGLSDELSFAVQRRHAPLVTVMDRMLSQMDPGEKQDLRSKWIAVSYGNGVDWATLWRWLVPVLGILLTAILVQGWNQVRLAREVQRRKETEVELERARALAERAAEAKAGFLATMSHEIRTPMSAIMGMVEILDGTELTPDQTDILAIVGEATRTLRLLLDDVLDVSRLEGGGMQLNPAATDVTALMSGIGELMEPDIWRKGVELNIRIERDLAPAYLLDELRLRQILLNLVGNATKFTAQGSIDLSVDVLAPRPGEATQRLRFAVADTGIGMSAEQLQGVLEPFVQATAATAQEHGGTGLGLAIVKGLVELMGGTVVISSALGRGTEVSFVLEAPLAQRQAGEHAEEATPPMPRRWRVLVAEDDAANRLMMQYRLDILGQDVVVAADGAQALERLKRAGDIDLLLTDCQMAGMDGYALMRAVRGSDDAAMARLPMVAMTASTSDAVMQACTSAGADRVLLKPFDIAALRSTMMSLLGGDEVGPPSGRVQPLGGRACDTGAPDALQAVADHAWQALCRQLGGAAVAVQMVDVLAVAFGEDAPALRQALRAGDAQEACRRIHRITGGLAVTGLIALADEGKRLEEAYSGGCALHPQVEHFLQAAGAAIVQLSLCARAALHAPAPL
ncbi:transporter substrate-binding domain-containing protein [Stenotrophomonas sp. ZAC14A_NAIMI4_1]|uniref:ATP-binding protein n=1 Tax=Stenotrophomonas sp. ZAC14A_NAIMI4_1 TaxID=2072412 RepID=UPI00131EE536|nr:transporter substrate-binding domain-containing protein [Stenotrophomonas sp. ZAC14A_NAIMI4_1]